LVVINDVPDAKYAGEEDAYYDDSVELLAR